MPEVPAVESPPEISSQLQIPESTDKLSPEINDYPLENKSLIQEEKNKWAEEIKKILEEKKYVYDQDIFERQLLVADRYLRLPVVEFDPSGEDNRMILQERFFKAPIPSENKDTQNLTRKSFIRQVLAQEYLDEHTNFPVTEVLEQNLDEAQGPMYMVMNWYQKGEGVGFMYGREASKDLREEHANLAVASIRSLHNREQSVPNDLAEILDRRTAFEDFAGLKNNLAEIFNRQVTGAGEFFQDQKRDFASVISQRLGVENFKEEVDKFVEELRPLIEAYQNRGVHLVHGDFAPNNIFLGDGIASEKFIGLDFEWAAVSQNELLASAYDFGNFRERAYMNQTFQHQFDQAMINSYTQDSHEEVGRAIVALGTLRSTLNLSSYFENTYEAEEDPVLKEEREGTERDLLRAWEVLGLEAPVAKKPEAV